jgi:hypothetical protein
VTIVFKDLQKLVSHSQQEQQNTLFERLRDKPFWIWDIKDHKQEDTTTDGDCCFNYIIRLPQKNGTDKPLFDYERIIFDSLIIQNNSTSFSSSKHKHLWIKKATGLGVTEFFLRLMAWLCLRNDDYQNRI